MNAEGVEGIMKKQKKNAEHSEKVQSRRNTNHYACKCRSSGKDHKALDSKNDKTLPTK